MNKYTTKEKNEILKNIRREAIYAGVRKNKPKNVYDHNFLPAISDYEPQENPFRIWSADSAHLMWSCNGKVGAGAMNIDTLDLVLYQIFDGLDLVIPVGFDNRGGNFVSLAE